MHLHVICAYMYLHVPSYIFMYYFFIKVIIFIKFIKSHESYLSTENKLFFPTFYKTLDKLKVNIESHFPGMYKLIPGTY